VFPFYRLMSTSVTVNLRKPSLRVLAGPLVSKYIANRLRPEKNVRPIASLIVRSYPVVS
jgi:hypothetical protein